MKKMTWFFLTSMVIFGCGLVGSRVTPVPAGMPTLTSEMIVTYIDITVPDAGAVLDASQPLNIQGMGAGLFEGNVVVRVEDEHGNILVLEPTTIEAPDAGVGGEGPWRIEILLPGDGPEKGKIIAYAPSPKDGSWMASDQVNVFFEKSSAAATAIEDIPWLLTAFADDDLSPLLSNYKITALFDSTEGSLGGSAGCNTYFAGYEINGDALILGPIGSTLMACAEPRMTLEATSIDALGSVTNFRLKDDELTLLDNGGRELLRFNQDPFSKTDQFTRQELENATYQSDFAEDGSVTLSQGEYFSAIADGAASNVYVSLANRTAFGDLDDNGDEEAALILVTNAGGSGSFVELVIVDKSNGELVHVATADLGDRVIINSLQVEGTYIVVDMITHGPDDGLCCPTVPVVQNYHLHRGVLTLMEEQ